MKSSITYFCLFIIVTGGHFLLFADVWPRVSKLHSTPKESIHFEFQQVGTQNLGHARPMIGYDGQLIGIPIQTKLSLRKNSKWFRVPKFEGMFFVSQ